MAERPVPLILDTDIGDDIDDLYALYLAVFHPRLDLRAVTTSHRSCLRKARFVEKALRVAGREDLPVGAGIDLSVARKALGQMNPDPGEMGTHLQWVTEGDPERANTYEYGPDLILAALDAAAEPVAIACIGACSNVAEALNRATPEQYEKIRCIALMSGEPERMMVEYNVLCDPEAADHVYNCGLPVFMGTYDVTRQLVMTMEDVVERFGACSHPACAALIECTELWAPHRGPKPGPVLYDLVPLFWIVDPVLVQTRPATIRVELRGQYTRGMTVRVAPEGPVLESVSLDAQDLVDRMVNIICGR